MQPEDYGADYYAKKHLADLSSRFQRYRAREVMALYNLGPDDRVLDLGCGWGTVTFAAADRARNVVGIDLSKEAIDRCRRKADEWSNVAFRVADAKATGLEPGSFDVAYAADLFEHLDPSDSQAVAVEAHRVLKPGGVLVVWTPCPSHLLQRLKARNILLKEDPTHIGYKSMAAMEEIMKKTRFAIVSACYRPSHWPGLSVVERLGWRWTPLLRRRIGIVGKKGLA